jgi:poly(A) polymerase/tRNA nucleotidyltransferase (CCA-adding enzyme)
MLGRKPKDWDIATNATPEEIQAIFPESVYENRFGTVGIKTGAEEAELKLIEATTFRTEGTYTDKRHPDEVRFAKTIEEDLARRDFTVNAMAHDGEHLVDPYGGREDLQKRRIRAVGNPKERFSEDALRLMRAVRIAAELGFSIEPETAEALRTEAPLLEMIAKERVRDEFVKLIASDNPDQGVELLREFGLLRIVLPELLEGWGVTQNKHHIYTVWEHNIRSLRYAAQENYSFHVRLASLLHDIGKPRTKRGEGPNATFYGHQIVGARMAMKALERLRFPKDDIEKIALLIRAHMFEYDPEKVTDAAVRRLIAKVGPENIKELIELREADRIGSGVPKARPYRLRHLIARIEILTRDFITRSKMAVNGDVLIEELGLTPGPRLGAILDALFEEIIDDPSRNEREYLLQRARELSEHSDEELQAMRRKSQEKYRALLEAEEEEIKRRHHVS